MMLLKILLFICTLNYGTAVPQLFHNADFEMTSFNANWACNGCTLTRISQHYHGDHSVQVSHRTSVHSGIRQTVTVTSGTNYVLSGYIKLLNVSPGHMYHKVKVVAKYTLHGHTHYISISTMNMLQKDFGWTEIGGDFHVPSGVHSIEIYIEIHESDVNYLVDNMSLQQLQTNSHWKSDAQQRITANRMSSLTVNVNNPSNLDTSNMQIEIKQLKHKFAFGSAVDATEMVDSAHHKYQEFFYDNFEWAVLENALKWRLMEWTKGHINYDKPLKAIDAMRGRGITVRGHNVFWDFDSHSPAWLHSLSSNQLLTEMHTRVNGVIGHTKGKVVHWDVNNENLHGDYFEQRLHQPNITYDMFRWVHQLDPAVKLFLNEYQVVNSNTVTTAYKVQASKLKTSNVPVYGVGVQSHFKSSNIDMDALKYRLDKIAEAGLPIWVTELSIKDTDANRKADALENALTMFFSHPAVEGVLLWGFWDGKIFSSDAALATGTNVTPNAAGLRYQKLFKQTWRTHITQQLQHGINISGYHGQYALNIKRNGHVIETQNFTLGSNGNTVTVTLHGTAHHPTSTSVFG